MNEESVLLKDGFQFEPIKRRVFGVRSERRTRAKLQPFPTTDKIGQQTERRFYHDVRFRK